MKTLATKHTTSHAWFDAVKHLADSNNWYDVHILVCSDSINKDYLLYIDFKKIDVTGLIANAFNVQYGNWAPNLLAVLLKRGAVFQKDAFPYPLIPLYVVIAIGMATGVLSAFELYFVLLNFVKITFLSSTIKIRMFITKQCNVIVLV